MHHSSLQWDSNRQLQQLPQLIAGNAHAEQLTAENSAQTVEILSRLRLHPGHVHAERLIPVSSVLTAERQHLQVSGPAHAERLTAENSAQTAVRQDLNTCMLY